MNGADVQRDKSAEKAFPSTEKVIWHPVVVDRVAGLFVDPRLCPLDEVAALAPTEDLDSTRVQREQPGPTVSSAPQ